MTKKLCTYVACRVVVNHSNDGTPPRCPKHPSNFKRKQPTTEDRKKLYAHQFDDTGKNIYASYDWKLLRAAKKLKDPLCEHCFKLGIFVPMKIADHIIEIEDGGQIWNIDNLQSLCKKCDRIKTARSAKERRRGRDNYGYFN